MTTDLCIFCGDSTAFGSTASDGTLIGKFVNRIPADDGWACAECVSFECDHCGTKISLDEEIRVDYTDDKGNWHFGNYHSECHDPAIHGPEKIYY